MQLFVYLLSQLNEQKKKKKKSDRALVYEKRDFAIFLKKSEIVGCLLIYFLLSFVEMQFGN